MFNTNQNEYEIARNYCLFRTLSKPKTNMAIAMKWLFLLELAAFLSAVSAYFVLIRLNIHFSFSTLHFIASGVLFLVFLKKICQLAIELYQHYASENTRRKCVLMPSCSEYALLALQKYNVFVALSKTYIRLTKKCSGSYKIDYP
jgi:putative component of membrane protein insertase Oxa1/YidC/SpoIIIJ protein YidD